MAVRIATFTPKRREESTGALESAAAAATISPGDLVEFSRALQLLEQTNARPGIVTTVPDSMVSNLQSFLSLELPADQGRVLERQQGALEVQFDEHDIIRWAGVFFTWLGRGGRFEWQTPDAPEPLPNRFRAAVLGDWGTGLYGAPVCSRSIQEDGKYQLLIHVGDVYYSGRTKEYKERFSDLWPKVPAAISRALNGNHEMYSGGHAYVDVIRGLGQRASYFALANDHWILACLDTAYDDHDLHGDQAAWLEGLAAAAPGKRLVVFSHHQPFSLLDSQGPKLVARLGRLLAGGRIYAWYWGHEHHCVLYDQHPLWKLFGRCVGHSGYPYFRETKLFGATAPAAATWQIVSGKNLVPGARVLDGKNVYTGDHPNDYGPNGYVTLEFDGPNLFEIVHEADGHVLWNQPVGDET
ncbi:MAG TPA: metallophosphoesterase [Vicinamibacterales bacterium]|nr:metallophosphoesterase [Vicinamibacterales bacterium]